MKDLNMVIFWKWFLRGAITPRRLLQARGVVFQTSLAF